MAMMSAAIPEAPVPPALEIYARSVDPESLARATEAGLDARVARVIAGRVSVESAEAARAVAAPSLRHLDHYSGLHDIERAASRVVQAAATGERIGLVTDFDCDGLTAQAVLRTFFEHALGLSAPQLQCFVGHRLNDGYGLTEPLVERMVAAMPEGGLIITADHGISDHTGVAQFAAHGCEVIVTDHHDLPAEGPPREAAAVINPKHPLSAYPDKHIAGCLVAWLLCCAMTRDSAAPPSARDFSLAGLLDYVALGTVADCVHLGLSRNNRAVVAAGLRRIRARARPCWRVGLKDPVDSATLAFALGPRINAASRMGDPERGLDFLLAPTEAQAQAAYAVLDRANQARKAIEAELQTEAAPAMATTLQRGEAACVVALETGHAGVHGLVAGRLARQAARTTLVFTPAEDGRTLTGSARAGEGVHVREALADADEAAPGAVVRFGGHAGAGGITVHAKQLSAFRTAFINAVADQLQGVFSAPVVETDGPIEGRDITLECYERLAAMQPYGQGFPAPAFSVLATVATVKAVGDGTHLKLTLTARDGAAFNAIWFSARPSAQDALPVSPGDAVTAAVSLSLDTYGNRRRLDCQVQGLVVNSTR